MKRCVKLNLARSADSGEYSSDVIGEVTLTEGEDIPLSTELSIMFS